MVSKTELVKRGWSRKLIEQFLPTPCQVKGNPRFRKAAPMCLYSAERIKEIESTEEFAESKLGVDKRKRSAALAAETKRQKLLEIVSQIKIVVPNMDLAVLEKKAIEATYAYQCSRGNCEWECGENDVDRHCVNFLRHECTSYDHYLNRLCGLVGKKEAVLLVREKVYEAISESYPNLADECDAQLSLREMQDNV